MRFRSLDAGRGIAALLVVLFHFSGRASHRMPGFGQFVPHAYLFVDFFFVLSGFIISYAYLNRLGAVEGEPRRFIIRRFGRLWPLHAVMLLVMAVKVAWSGALSFGLWTPDGLNPVLTNIFLIQGLGLHHELLLNPPSWSISTEFWTYIVFLLLAWLVPRWMPWFAAALALLGALVVFQFSTHGMDTTYDFGFFRCLTGFFTGYFVYLALRRWHDAVPAGTVAEIGVVIVAIAFIIVCGASGNAWAELAPLVFAVVVAVFALERGRLSWVLRAAPLQHLGAISYSIYMVHVPVLQFFTPFLPERLTLLTGNEWRLFRLTHAAGSPATTVRLYLLLALYLAIVLVLANLTYYLVEQPGRRLFNRLAGGSPRKVAAASAAGVGEEPGPQTRTLFGRI